MIWINVIVLCGAYLLGSISSAIIVCKLLSLPDPRTQGSNNPGATNVMRIGGKKAAAFTLAGDIIKGLLPALLAHSLGMSSAWVMLIGFAAFIGHLYPIFFSFQGGKGVATLIGVLFGFSIWLGLGFVSVWFVMAKVFKISSLSALVAAFLSPIFTWFYTHDIAVTVIVIMMTALLTLRHKENIQKLLSGEEDSIGKTKDALDD